MGVIQRQSFKYSIINFIGVGIGILSVLFIYPKALEVVGLFRSLFDASVLATIVVRPADHGSEAVDADLVDEINLLVPGGNFGWPCYTGAGSPYQASGCNSASIMRKS